MNDLPEMIPNSILLFVHPPFYKVGDRVFFDTQAQNGLRLWAANFETVRVMAPLIDTAPQDVPSDAGDLQPFLEAHQMVEPIMLPQRGTRRFLIEDLSAGKKVIRDQIKASQFLVFAFSGYLGDWGTVACLTAARMGRPFAAFKDSVDHHIAQIEIEKEKRALSQQLSRHFQRLMIKYRDRIVLRKSDLALLHGRDTMDYYAPFASNPHLVHDIHLSKDDQIHPDALELRLAERDKTTLRIVYAGRVEEIKGPDQWVKALSEASREGAALTARWYGNGTLLDKQKAQLAERYPEAPVSFEGYMPHDKMLKAMQQADVFAFTHLTNESPRCLIEALAAGLPIVGYDSAFARDLTGTSRAGLFVPRGDEAALKEAIKALASDPDRVEAMAWDARKVASPLNDEDVFRHRSDIIKEAL